MPVSISRGEQAKLVFLQEFSHDELWKIFFLRFKCGIGKSWKFESTIEDFFQKINISQLFDFLHYIIFGGYGCGGKFEVVVNYFPQLKKMLRETVLPDYLIVEQNYGDLEFLPTPPRGITVHNQLTGDIIVTLHAWKRFCVRYPTVSSISEKPIILGQEYFVRALQVCFERSDEVELRMVGRIRRMINNRFQPARYFYDKETNLRFVVVDSNRLTTVERADYK